MLDNGTLRRYIDEFSITGLTSNPTIFDEAIGAGDAYDDGIRAQSGGRESPAKRCSSSWRSKICAALPICFAHLRCNRSVSMDGFRWSYRRLLADDTARSIDAATQIYQQGGRANLFVKIPGTPAGVPAIEESIFAGVPINVTLLFSREQYLAAAEAYLRGIERRVAAGLDARVGSVASVFVSRWDRAVSDKVPAPLRNRLGIAIARRTYRAYRELLASPRWRKLADTGAQPQRLLWGSTGTKDPQASATLYIEALAAPDTINTMPEKTLLAFAEHGQLRGVMPEDGGDAEAVLARFAEAGIDVDALANQLQQEGAQAFVKSWNALLRRIAEKSEVLADAGAQAARY